mgnify:CR=1 FL=1
MKKGWKIFWTVIISLTGAGVVFCIIALCLGQVDLSGMLDGVGDADGITTSSQASDVTGIYTVSSQGVLKELRAAYSTAIHLSIPATPDSPARTMDMTCAYDTTITVKATGSAVKITYPDLSGFVEIDMD